MKVAHVADIHWGLGYPGPTPFARHTDITIAADLVANQIIKANCDVTLVAGDLFKDANVFINRASQEITTAVAWLRKLTEHMPVVVISGTPSHDAVAAYRIIKEMRIPRLYIATTPEIITIGSAAIVCVPGMNRSNFANSDEYKGKSASEIHQAMTEQITALCMGARANINTPIKILMAHLTAEGADKGFDDLKMQHEPILKKEAMAGYDLVCLGHIHRPQQIPGVPAYYPGSIERLSFRDEGIKTGFYIHDFDDFWHIAGAISTYITIPARGYFSMNFSGDEAHLLCGPDINFGPALEDKIKDNIVRVKYECTDEQAKLINPNRIRQALYNAGAYYVTEIKPVVTKTTRTRAQEATAEITPVEALGIYCNLMGIAEVAELTERTKSIMEEVEA